MSEEVGQLWQQARCLLEEMRIDEAARAAERLPYEAPDAVAYHRLMERICQHQDKYAEAIRHNDVLLALTCEPADYARRSVIFMEKGEQTSAQAAAEEAVRLAPHRDSYRVQAAECYLTEGKYEEALVHTGWLSAHRPEFGRGFRLHGEVLLGLGRDEEALHAALRAMTLNDQDLKACLLWLKLCARCQATEMTCAMAGQLEKTDIGHHPTIGWCLANTLYAEGDYEGALRRLDAMQEDLEDREEMPEWIADYYCKLAICTGIADGFSAGSRQRVLDLIDRGLACAPDHEELAGYRDWLLGGSARRDP